MKSHLLIIDSNSDRKKKIASALSPYANVFYKDEGKYFKNKKYVDSPDFPLEFDIVFRHAGDARNSVSNIAKFVIVFSGGNLNKQDLQPNEYGLTFALSRYNIEQSLNRELLEKLFLFFSKSTEPPPFLTNSTFKSVLIDKYQDLFLEDKQSEKESKFSIPIEEDSLTLLICQPELTANFTEYIRRRFILNENVKNQVRTIDSRSQWDQFEENKDFSKKYATIFISSNLNWTPINNASSTEYICRKLRGLGVKSPIVVFSNSQQLQLLHRNKLIEENSILNTPLLFTYSLDLHQFTEESESQLAEAKELEYYFLSQETLRDIQYYRIEMRGMLHEIIHNLRYPYDKEHWSNLDNTSQAERTYTYLNTRIKTLLKGWYELGTLNMLQDILECIKKDISEYVGKLDENKIRGIIRQHEQSLEMILPQNTSQKNLLDPKKKKHDWGILIVDDQQTVLDNLKKILSGHKIEIFTARTGIDAINILKKDSEGKLEINGESLPPNYITVLISDWRMFEATQDSVNLKWQLLQGPDLIRYVTMNLKNDLAYYILTGKTGEIIRQAKKRFKYNVGWFTKEEVIGNSIGQRQEDFAHDILLAGDKKFLEICHRPSSRAWDRLIDIYQAFRSSDTILYKEINHKISNISQSWVDEITTNLQVENQQETPVLDKLPDLNDLGANLQGVSDLSDIDNRRIFINKMAARRIAIYLSVEGFRSEDIAYLLREKRYKHLDASLVRKFRPRFNDLWSTHLSLKRDKILDPLRKNRSYHVIDPKHFLLEEINWIESQYTSLSLGVSDRALLSEIKDLVDRTNALIIEKTKFLPSKLKSIKLEALRDLSTYLQELRVTKKENDITNLAYSDFINELVYLWDEHPNFRIALKRHQISVERFGSPSEQNETDSISIQINDINFILEGF